MKTFQNRLIMNINDINVDDLPHLIHIKNHWRSRRPSVDSVVMVTTPFYFRIFESFITKVSCAVVLPANVNALKWNRPYSYHVIPRVEVNKISLA